jgi:hypothetical protein
MRPFRCRFASSVTFPCSQCFLQVFQVKLIAQNCIPIRVNVWQLRLLLVADGWIINVLPWKLSSSSFTSVGVGIAYASLGGAFCALRRLDGFVANEQDIEPCIACGNGVCASLARSPLPSAVALQCCGTILGVHGLTEQPGDSQAVISGRRYLRSCAHHRHIASGGSGVPSGIPLITAPQSSPWTAILRAG